MVHQNRSNFRFWLPLQICNDLWPIILCNLKTKHRRYIKLYIFWILMTRQTIWHYLQRNRSMFQLSTHMELSRSMAAILEMPQYVAYQKNVVYAFLKLSAKSHSFNILCTMNGLSCPTMSFAIIQNICAKTWFTPSICNGCIIMWWGFYDFGSLPCVAVIFHPKSSAYLRCWPRLIMLMVQDINNLEEYSTVCSRSIIPMYKLLQCRPCIGIMLMEHNGPGPYWPWGPRAAGLGPYDPGPGP